MTSDELLNLLTKHNKFDTIVLGSIMHTVPQYIIGGKAYEKKSSVFFSSIVRSNSDAGRLRKTGGVSVDAAHQ